MTLGYIIRYKSLIEMAQRIVNSHELPVRVLDDIMVPKSKNLCSHTIQDIVYDTLALYT